MKIEHLLIFAFAVSSFLLFYSWVKKYGASKGLMAALFRIGWISILFFCLFPKQVVIESKESLKSTPISVFVDDSQSMKSKNFAGASTKVREVTTLCKAYSCDPQFTYLSDLDPLVKKGFSPLWATLPRWIESQQSSKWIILSDGGDSSPTLSWPERLGRIGKESGLIVSFASNDRFNLYIKDYKVPPFAFENKQMTFSVTVGRSGNSLTSQNIQLQVINGKKTVATENIYFQDDEKEATSSITTSSLSGGNHLLTLKVLPAPGETTLWDNEVQPSVEVLTDTLGILHILGEPSWDGRFLRRYIKSEPKFDLISFFILRDHQDHQTVSDRELSLIPFPVEKLFTEELPNFSSVVLQDFDLTLFLQPRFQQNLVKFVKDGGGLLYIGGERALRTQDLINSPLREILPFSSNKISKKPSSSSPLFGRFIGGPSKIDKSGPWFESELEFEIELAEPTEEQKSLATVFDDWTSFSYELKTLGTLTGLHHLENVSLSEKNATPLLNARLKDGQTIPLALASYPGKGRAIWILTDQIWQLAMRSEDGISRTTYNKLMDGAFRWLLRKSLRKPMTISQISILDPFTHSPHVSFSMNGPAVQYLEDLSKASINICGEQLRTERLTSKPIGKNEIVITAELSKKLQPGEICEVSASWRNQSSGHISSNKQISVPPLYKDTQSLSSHIRLQKLSDLTEAKLIPVFDSNQMEEWIRIATGSDQKVAKRIKETIDDYYWVFGEWWAYALMLLLPFEVLVRKWRDIF